MQSTGTSAVTATTTTAVTLLSLNGERELTVINTTTLSGYITFGTTTNPKFFMPAGVGAVRVFDFRPYEGSRSAGFRGSVFIIGNSGTISVNADAM